MRKPKVLLIPFRFADYPQERVEQQIEDGIKLVEDLNIEVIAAHQIITEEDADKLVDKFSPASADFVLLLVPTWIEPPLVMRAVKPYFGKPMVLWGYTTFENKGWRVHMGGMAGSGVVHGSLRAMGVEHLSVYGMPDNSEVKEKIGYFANFARAKAMLDKSKIGMVGYVFAGMHAASLSTASIRKTIGPEIEHIDTYSLIRRMENIKEESKEYKAGAKKITSYLACETSLNEKELSRITRMYLALEQFSKELNLQAITVKCHFELSQEFGQSACIPLSVLGNDMVASCEADIPVVISQLMMHYLSGGETTSYTDIHDIANGKLLIGACGYAPTCMCIKEKILCGRVAGAGEGIGASFSGWIVNSSPMKEGKVTMARLINEKGKYVMHYVTGNAVGDIGGKVSELDCPAYPTTEVKLDTDMERFTQNLGSHHYAMVYKDISKEIESLCRLMDIDVVYG